MSMDRKETIITNPTYAMIRFASLGYRIENETTFRKYPSDIFTITPGKLTISYVEGEEAEDTMIYDAKKNHVVFKNTTCIPSVLDALLVALSPIGNQNPELFYTSKGKQAWDICQNNTDGQIVFDNTKES